RRAPGPRLPVAGDLVAVVGPPGREALGAARRREPQEEDSGRARPLERQPESGDAAPPPPDPRLEQHERLRDVAPADELRRLPERAPAVLGVLLVEDWLPLRRRLDPERLAPPLAP